MGEKKLKSGQNWAENFHPDRSRNLLTWLRDQGPEHGWSPELLEIMGNAYEAAALKFANDKDELDFAWNYIQRRSHRIVGVLVDKFFESRTHFDLQQISAEVAAHIFAERFLKSNYDPHSYSNNISKMAFLKKMVDFGAHDVLLKTKKYGLKPVKGLDSNETLKLLEGIEDEKSK